MIRAKTLSLGFALLFAAFPPAFMLASQLGGADWGDAVEGALFLVGLALEVTALVGALRVRRHFDPSDSWWTVWTLVVAFLVVRILAELRLATLLSGLVPFYDESAPGWVFVYVVGFRYLYTLADVLFLAALALTIRSYRESGFDFEVRKRDYAYMAPLVAATGVAFWLRDMLTTSGDEYLEVYRLVAVTVALATACLCIVVRRYTLQMGGGAVARVWTAVVLAAAARVASFVSVAVVARFAPADAANFVEQYLIAIFASFWVLATVYQRDVWRRAAGVPGLTMDGSLKG